MGSCSSAHSQAQLLQQVDPKRAVARISRHLTGIFFTLATLCYLDRANLAFAASQLRQDLDISASTYGLGAGASHHETVMQYIV